MIDDFPRRPEWSKQGICNTGDAALVSVFFPRVDPNSRHHPLMEEAKVLCEYCPVKQQCLDYSLDLPENPHGVWGGTDLRDRAPMRRERHGNHYGLNYPIEHGTNAGYEAHRRRGEDPCAECRQAHAQKKAHRVAVAS